MFIDVTIVRLVPVVVIIVVIIIIIITVIHMFICDYPVFIASFNSETNQPTSSQNKALLPLQKFPKLRQNSFPTPSPYNTVVKLVFISISYPNIIWLI